MTLPAALPSFPQCPGCTLAAWRIDQISLSGLRNSALCWAIPQRPCVACEIHFELSRLLSESNAHRLGLAFPQTIRPTQGSVGDGWLLKPFDSAGGHRIRRWSACETEDVSLSGYCLQRFVEGGRRSAVFVADGMKSALLGVTEQLVGCKWAGAQEFQYCGSIGPLVCSAAWRERLVAVGRLLASRFQLRGLFGVDVIEGDARTYLLGSQPALHGIRRGDRTCSGAHRC